MKILFITHFYHPHIGGVEKHVLELSKELKAKGKSVTILTEKYNDSLKDKETDDGIEVVRIAYPRIKLVGLLVIWWQVLKHWKLFINADIVHIHDVFVWYLPIKLFLPFKKVYVTFHGWEGKWPIPWPYVFQKKLGAILSSATICVGKYIEKYYGIKSDRIVYGGVPINRLIGKSRKVKNKVVFVGRLEADTGLQSFLKRLDEFKYRDVTFVGDGSLRDKCEKYGQVTGFTNPAPYLREAEYAVPGGYLSYIDATSSGCKIITYADSPLKQDYWKEIKKIKRFLSWSHIADEYIKLWSAQ